MRYPPFVPGPRLPDGRVPMVAGPMKQHIRSYTLLPRPTVLSLVGLGAPDEMEFRIDLEGHFEWKRLITSPQDAPGTLVQVVLDLFDPQKQRKLSNRPVHFQTVAAVVDLGYRLPEPYLFNVGDGLRTFNVTARKLDAGNFDLHLAMKGIRYYHTDSPPEVAIAMNEIMKGNERAHTYWMTYKEVDGDGTPPTILAGANPTFTFKADDDADCELHYLSVPAGTPDFTFTLREKDTNRLLMNERIHRQMGWGDGEFPFLFADGYLLERSKELLFDVQNDGQDPIQVFATIGGRRLVT